MTFTSLIIDVLMCFLLGAAAIMCWRVDQRFKAMREGQDGLNTTITALNEAVERSRASLAALDRASRDQGATLKDDVEAARKLSDELRFLIDQGELVAAAKSRSRLPSAPSQYEPAKSTDDTETTLAARRRLETLKALR
jgi:hypothetical protein